MKILAFNNTLEGQNFKEISTGVISVISYQLSVISTSLCLFAQHSAPKASGLKY
ncbi:MAG: hypothetical protein F6K17_20705 [Okeania sp. SIO3C4]|nr:hypothetical protein [Okeania sp. SIO3B3]NER04845.1 hypothetical protein [Okeania sp. SIO3C4]